MTDWRRRFSDPVYLWDGTVIASLADARAWLIEIDSQRIEFQAAAGLLMSAADGGDIKAARQQIAMAAFLNMKLDVTKTRD